MENDIYNHNELKFYHNVFKYLKRNSTYDSSGNISAFDVNSFLLASSKLPKDIIDQIGEVTGGSVRGWYDERRLFFALKLIAAAQQRIPISNHTLLHEIDLPLPNLFTNNNMQNDLLSEDSTVKDKVCPPSPNLIQLSDSDCPPTLERVDNGYQIMVSDDMEEDDVEGFCNDPTANFTSQTPAYSPASDAPTPTNRDHTSQWPNLMRNEEHHQLLGTEDDSSDQHSSEGEGPNHENEPQETNATSDPEEDDDVWNMSEEQQQYYTHHFTSMQPDLNGFIPGNVAKQFFEKSKLPVAELSQIWQLCDVTRDGALSVEEFYAAMHLVVLRRNNIPLPSKLPSSLMPKSYRHWTKFGDSPTSTLSSPGPKPVNFDFQNSALEKNPQILHPTPVRVTPETLGYDKLDGENFFEDVEKQNVRNRKEDLLENTFDFQECQEEIFNSHPSTREPLPASSSSIAVDNGNSGGPTSLPFMIPASKKDVPPPPPPRPSKSHARSASLDLNKLDNLNISAVNSVSSGSPRVTINTDAPGSLKVNRICKINHDSSTRKNLRTSAIESSRVSAFEIYRKPHLEEESSAVKGSSSDEGENARNSSTFRVSDKRNVLSTLYTKREKNAVLQRLNSELNQELAEVIEERISLEFQLEQMKHLS